MADDMNIDEHFQEGCHLKKDRHGNVLPAGDNRKRNWLTGYCRVPCPEGERRHPGSGVCTSLEELEEEGLDLGLQYQYEPVQRSIVDRSAEDRRDRFDDNHEGNAWCGDGQHLNIATGKCKIKPVCEVWQAVNPRTGRCAAREYLKRQVTDLEPSGPRLYEGEDDIPYTNDRWVPHDNTLLNNRVNMQDMRNFIISSLLTVADLRTMRGVHHAATTDGLKDDGQIGGDLDLKIVGLYSPPQRKKCENSTFTRFLVSDFYACGFRKADSLPVDNPGDYLESFIVHVGNDEDFIFLHDLLTPTMMKRFMRATQRSKENRKFAVVAPEGVWRVLVRYEEFVGTLEENYQYIDAIDLSTGAPNATYELLAGFLDGLAPNTWCVSWHRFDDLTMV